MRSMFHRFFLMGGALLALGVGSSFFVMLWMNSDGLRINPVTIGTAVNYVTDIASIPDTHFILILSRGGRIVLIQETDDQFKKIAETKLVDIVTARNCGAFGMTLDPDFATNNSLYISHCNAKGMPTVSRLTYNEKDFVQSGATAKSVFTIDDKRLLNANALFMISNIVFDEKKNLLLAIGDYGIIDVAQNPNNPFGKVLRVTPTATGFSIPKDNPFAGQQDADQKIYAIGLQMPWKILKSKNGSLWITDIGSKRKSSELNILKTPGDNFGWGAGEACKSCRQPVKVLPDESVSHFAFSQGDYHIAWVGAGVADDELLFADWCTGTMHTISANDGSTLALAGKLSVPISSIHLEDGVFLATYSATPPSSCVSGANTSERTSDFYFITHY